MAVTTTEFNTGTGGSKILDDTLVTVDGVAAPVGAKAQLVKLGFGVQGQFKSVSAADPVPTADDVLSALVGAVAETAPTSDTESSGLNGRLQRIAQRLTGLIAQLPISLGPKASSASLSVVAATGTATSASGSITVGGTAQTLVASNANRRGLTVQNTSVGDLRVNPWGSGASATVGYQVTQGFMLVLDAPHCDIRSVSIWGATTGQTFQAAEAV